jgi:uncharacterized cupin superfamily protein
MNKKAALVIRIDDRSGTEEKLPLDPSRLAPGSAMPEQFARNLFSDPGGRFHTGIWRSSRGAWRVSYTENELCVLTQGRVRLSDDDGHSWTFAAGEAFLVPSGFQGLWETLEPAQKFYAIYEPPAEPPAS